MQNLWKSELLFSHLLNKTKTIHQQPVRYTRKPRWLPIAPSKIFRVPKRPQVSIEERNELFNLFTMYRTCMKSIKKQLEEELEKTDTGYKVLQEIAKKDEEQWAKCLSINENWNAEIAISRDQRLARNKEVLRNDIMTHLIENEEEKRKKLEEIENIVKLEKEKSKNFITIDNIDEAIEKALDNVVDHNYAIDLRGNIYRGMSKPNDQEVENNNKKLRVQTINN
ncbi:probable 28S ribosomal protein S26, mitochondrial [Adelges cooleyi]|uniref:probable 28S ribosomal protein S26, mitochondrial n=1 Tax=Adelges cooleyi TaxID=133065 RepID=UPI002180944C|nr:probable 28S ribosomal protein S26, mitochondrial [Adelges cooleyi]XP_050424211.1 probable 28S ribosomal protein S26, mitochondrial [Adelges cooleyi]